MLAFNRTGERAPETVQSVDEQDGDARRVRRLLCRACQHPITDEDARITVDDRHEHQGVNPGGYLYRFGCFSSAPGCVSRGVPSKQWTWFPGYFWHIQACAGCGEHLGWLFFTDEHSFHGLILSALVEERDKEEG